MEATRPISPEDNRPNLRVLSPVELTRGSGPSQKQSQPLSPVTQSTVASDNPDAGQPISTEVLGTAVGKLRDYAQSIERSLSFSVDEDSGRTVIKVLDAETDEVIRQIPSAEALKILRHIAESGEDGARNLQGLLVREQA